MKLKSKINGQIYPYNEWLSKNPNLEVYFEPENKPVEFEEEIEIVYPEVKVEEPTGEYKKGKRISKKDK